MSCREARGRRTQAGGGQVSSSKRRRTLLLSVLLLQQAAAAPHLVLLGRLLLLLLLGSSSAAAATASSGRGGRHGTAGGYRLQLLAAGRDQLRNVLALQLLQQPLHVGGVGLDADWRVQQRGAAAGRRSGR